jgi:hypothetical protein
MIKDHVVSAGTKGKEAAPVPDAALEPIHDSEQSEAAIQAGLKAMEGDKPADSRRALRDARQQSGE